MAIPATMPAMFRAVEPSEKSYPYCSMAQSEPKICDGCKQLREDLRRAFGHLAQSADPATRKTAEQFINTQQNRTTSRDEPGRKVAGKSSN